MCTELRTHSSTYQKDLLVRNTEYTQTRNQSMQRQNISKLFKQDTILHRCVITEHPFTSPNATPCCIFNALVSHLKNAARIIPSLFAVPRNRRHSHTIYYLCLHRLERERETTHANIHIHMYMNTCTYTKWWRCCCCCWRCCCAGALFEWSEQYRIRCAASQQLATRRQRTLQ